MLALLAHLVAAAVEGKLLAASPVLLVATELQVAFSELGMSCEGRHEPELDQRGKIRTSKAATVHHAGQRCNSSGSTRVWCRMQGFRERDLR